MTVQIEAGYGDPLAVGLQRPMGAPYAGVLRCCGGLAAPVENAPAHAHAAGCEGAPIRWR